MSVKPLPVDVEALQRAVDEMHVRKRGGEMSEVEQYVTYRVQVGDTWLILGQQAFESAKWLEISQRAGMNQADPLRRQAAFRFESPEQARAIASALTVLADQWASDKA